MFGRRFKPQQFDYEPSYYDPEAEKKKAMPDLSKSLRRRIKFHRMPKPSVKSGNVSIVILFVAFALLAYVYITISDFNMSDDMPTMTPLEESLF